MKTLKKVEKTERGFEVIEFEDCYSEKCTLQQSSLAEFEPPGTSAIWLGVNGLGNRMHLNLEQVKELVEVLNRWIANGSFGE